MNNFLAAIGMPVLIVSAWCHAEPIVISDYGGRASGVPNQEMVRKIQGQMPQRSVGVLKVYPVLSGMRPGYIDEPIPLQVPQPKAKPFFIVGNDEFSRDWIEKNKEYLLEIRAQGLATNIESEAVLKDLQAWAHPLDVIAIPVDEIAEVLNINVYPVLITGEEIAQ